MVEFLSFVITGLGWALIHTDYRASVAEARVAELLAADRARLEWRAHQ